MFEKLFNKENKENGKNVLITIKFMRHGERDKDGNLLDIGREKTAINAEEFAKHNQVYDAVKAIGSPAGPASDVGMQRALETSDIYANVLDKDNLFNTRVNKFLSYETLITKPPYDHREIYNQSLPENYNELSDEEKVVAAKIANSKTVEHLDSLATPEAIQYKKELGGAEAVVVEHYANMAKNLKKDSKVLITAGGHGGMLEYLLTQTMVAIDEDGNKHDDWTINKIGGDLHPSEAFNIDIKTDEKGELMDLVVSFDGANRPNFPKMYLDKQKLKELADFYKELHKYE